MDSIEKVCQFFTLLYGGDYSGNEKYKALVKGFLDSTTDPSGQATLSDPMILVLDHPYDLVVEYGFPFRYMNNRNGQPKIKTTSFEMELERIYAGVFDILRMANGKGSTWMSMEWFTKELLLRFPKITKPFFDACLTYFDKKQDPIDKLSPKKYRIWCDGKRIGFDRDKENEEYIANRVTTLLREETCSTFDFHWEPSEDLCEEQNEAVEKIMQSDFSILTGGPGTGKTTTINVILEEYTNQYENKNVVLMAPTGKAAKRMDECTGGTYRPSTVHYLTLKEKYHRAEGAQDHIDFCVIDEGSMLSLSIFREMLQYVDIEKLLIVGDVHQLEAVECGDILHDLIDLSVPTAYLTENHRSGDAILVNANKINHGDVNLVYNDHFRMIPAEDNEIDDIVKAEYGGLSTMVLCPYRSETNTLNRKIRAVLFPDTDTHYTVGDRILFLKNNRQAGYVNGDTGTVVSMDADRMAVTLDGDDTHTIVLRGKMFNDITFAYALTVHKSQGSEYNRVIVCIPKGTSSFFARNILYTAVTRAKTDVVIIGSERELKTLILKSPVRRNTFLKLHAA